MRAPAARLSRAVRRTRCFGPGDRVAVAVSGGSDSVALTWLLHSLEPETGAPLVGLIHLNHLLRGDDSDADEQFCRDLAARLGLPIEVARTDVGERARRDGCSIEVAARRARYGWFATARDPLRADLVATGHTADDQAETVLLRLLRGAGTRGLSGIRRRRGWLVRPLLDCRRVELRRYLDERGETWREDASNADVRIARNRLRQELMPVLTRIAPGGVGALARLAALANDDETYLTSAAAAHRDAVVVDSSAPGAHVSLDVAALARLPSSLARRLIRLLASEVDPEAALSARHLEAVCRLLSTDKPAGHLDLPGLVADRRGDTLRIGRADLGDRVATGCWPSRQLAVPGSVAVPEAGVVVHASRGEARAGMGARETAAVLNACDVALPLFVRNRRPGDRFRPLGAPGRRKLQDVLVDRKIPRAERDFVPVVIDADGQIVWVAGVAVAERCRVGTSGEGVLLLELRKDQ